MPNTTLRFGRRTGLSLIEVVIGVGLMGGILGLAGMVAGLGRGALRETTAKSDLDTECHRVADRLVSELTGVSSSMLFPDPDLDGSDQVSFQLPASFQGGVQWGPTTRLSLEYDTGELDDGVDNDGDGLIDECALVLTRNPGPGEVRTVLTDSVAERLEGEILDGDDDNGNHMEDEGGFCLQREGNVLIVRVTLACMGEEELMTRTAELSIEMKD